MFFFFLTWIFLGQWLLYPPLKLVQKCTESRYRPLELPYLGAISILVLAGASVSICFSVPRVQKYPPKWVTVSNSPYSPVKQVFFPALYKPRFTSRMSHDFPMIFPWFTGNWSPLAMLPRWSSTTVTSARILLASCLSWMAWLWTNFHMHNFCVCFGRLAPAKKKIRRSFFGAKKTKKTASVHQHEE